MSGDPELYTPSEVAHLIGAPAVTVRRWAADYAAFLSPTANPGGGLTRRFTPLDLRTLGYIRHRASGRTTADVAAELQALRDDGGLDLALPTLAELETHITPTQALQDGPGGAIVPASDGDPMRILLAALTASAHAQESQADAMTRIADLEPRIRALELELFALKAEVARLKLPFWKR